MIADLLSDLNVLLNSIFVVATLIATASTMLVVAEILDFVAHRRQQQKEDK